MKVLVGYDDTVEAAAALERAIALVRTIGAELVVANVATGERPSRGDIEPAPFAAPSIDSLRLHGDVVGEPAPAPERVLDADDLALRHLESARARLHEAGVEAHVVRASGDPADALCRLADERGINLIVVGARDLGFVRRVFSRSVSDHVARRAHCDVWIVHTRPQEVTR